MPQLPGAYLAGQVVGGIVDGTIITGATLIADGTQGQILVYEGDPAAGNLIGSWSGLAIQDPYGNSVLLGLALQGSGTVFTVLGADGANIVIDINAGLPYLGMATGAAEEAQAGGLESQIENPGTSEILAMYVFGPKGSTHTDQVWIDLNSQAADGSSDALGELLLGNATGSHVWLTWGASGISVYSPIAGDSNAYQTERVTVYQTSTDLVNSATPAQFMTTLTVGTGAYRVHGQLSYTPVSNSGPAVFEFGGGSTVCSHFGVFFNETVSGSPSGQGAAADVTSFGGSFTGTTWSGTAVRSATFDGVLVVTTAGELGIFAAATSGSYNINVGGTYMELNPIGS